MPGRDIVVIGASAGGVETLRGLAAGLPADVEAAVFVVVHFPTDQMSFLPRILGRSGPLPAFHARSGEPIQPGRIYVAPPITTCCSRTDAWRLIGDPESIIADRRSILYFDRRPVITETA